MSAAVGVADSSGDRVSDVSHVAVVAAPPAAGRAPHAGCSPSG